MWRVPGRTDGGGNAFLLRPNIVGQHEGDVAFIADSKWKRLKPQHFRVCSFARCLPDVRLSRSARASDVSFSTCITACLAIGKHVARNT
jgi:hypothetical protein